MASPSDEVEFYQAHTPEIKSVHKNERYFLRLYSLFIKAVFLLFQECHERHPDLHFQLHTHIAGYKNYRPF